MRELEAASDLKFIERNIKPTDLALLIRVAIGDSYDIIALTLGLRPRRRSRKGCARAQGCCRTVEQDSV